MSITAATSYVIDLRNIKCVSRSIWRKNVPKFIFSGLIPETMNWSMAWVTACLVSLCFCTREGCLGMSWLVSDSEQAVTPGHKLQITSGNLIVTYVKGAERLWRRSGMPLNIIALLTVFLKLGFKNLLLKKGKKQITAVMFCFHGWQSAFSEILILGRNPLPSKGVHVFISFVWSVFECLRITQNYSTKGWKELS